MIGSRVLLCVFCTVDAFSSIFPFLRPYYPTLLFPFFALSFRLFSHYVDSIFGAFLFGLIMPRDSHLFKECNEKIEELVLSLTLPLYFALSGESEG